MEMFEACEAFSSLAQETRLRALRLLIQYGCDGTSPGTIARELGIPDNTLSFHLSHLSKAGLVTSRKSGRTVTYFANTSAVSGLVSFLLENCCAKEKKPKGKERKC